jgi:hypothetical protein
MSRPREYDPQNEYEKQENARRDESAAWARDEAYTIYYIIYYKFNLYYLI